ncbi:MAG: phosphohistidine phosphatase SixA [Burkholderiaceae bacterium]|nr:phosphohistidine phosphatase SixA [Burkholderiaceae bacterium]
MDLILWRHAEAEVGKVGENDEDRVLTSKGHRQAWKMGEWLERTLPNTTRILVSPTRRTVQTAEALGRKYKINPGLAPSATAESILSIVNWPEAREPVLVVGHQPTLGRIVAYILTGKEQDWAVRKSTAVWIAQKERGESATNYLKAVMAPDMLGK